jgi:biotin carboxylase
VITFSETDIEIAEQASELLGVPDAAPRAARTARNKALQRAYLADYDVPSVWYHAVSDIGQALNVAADRGFPVIVKPTRAASSDHVELVHDRGRLSARLAQIADLAASRHKLYYDQPESSVWALVEEYLPGEEVTVDGVVLGGRFTLGGVYHKAPMEGPFFAEDLYTMPYSEPDLEAGFADIAQRIVDGLAIRTCLFTVELRADAHGRYRVVEFSVRGSGGQMYRLIRDVYGIDLVRQYARACLGDDPDAIRREERQKGGPYLAGCTKLVYGEGLVQRNDAGPAIFSPHFRSYMPIARPGAVVHSDTEGIDFVGSLSVWCRWQPEQSPSVVQEIANRVADELDIVISR